ncbi:Inositol monophosphatase-like [Trypanosoma melophagium]|uniref:Inositol monophosphatase-like n=1 Tax=Trypanosoma melophagium TaxID=715481 RepID=UPI00351A4AB6|nr:Inositol monophosphatase-like [Trypanosoma melophagium]
MEEYDIDLEEALGVAIEAARKAGNIMWEFYQYRREAVAADAARAFRDDNSNDNNNTDSSRSGKATALLGVVEKSSSTDLVTKYDKMCDEAITKILKRFSAGVERAKQEAGFSSFTFNFITEEICPDAPLTDAPTWIVDPIDGTMSFVHGACDCCVSIGLTIRKVTVLAVVYCPFLSPVRNALTGSVSNFPVGEMYTAIRGKGAFLNGHPIRPRLDATPENAMVVFNYPTNARLSDVEKQASVEQHNAIKKQKHEKIIEAASHIRRKLVRHPVQGLRGYGACVLILAQIAAGRVDLYMEPAGMVWDVCAGSLLVTEAGGVVKNIWGESFGMEGSTTIVAAANETIAAFGAQLCTEVKYGDFWLK